MQQAVRGTTKLVLLSLADRADENSRAWPSCARVVADTGLDRKTVLKAIKEIIEAGLMIDTGVRIGQGSRVFQLVGVAHREALEPIPKTGYPKNGTGPKNGMPTYPKNGTSTYPKNGIQNLSGNQSRNRSVVKRKATQVPADFTVTDDMLSWASQNTPTIDPVRETPKFVDHHRAKGSTFKDHIAAWRNWMRNAVKFQQPVSRGTNGREAMYQAMRELCDD